MKIMFLDESGHHSLKPRHLHGAYPIFVLGGVIVDRAYVRNVIEPDLQAFKGKYFGSTDIVLHTVEMNAGTGPYAFLSDARKRERFYEELNGLIRAWDFRIVACVVKKAELVARLGNEVEDPYTYSLDLLIDHFCELLVGTFDGGATCAERRGGGLDSQLMQRWEVVRTRGTQNTSAKAIDERIVSLDLRDKRPNLAGMQVADLVITPIGRHILGTSEKPNRIQWRIVEQKLVRGGSGGDGLIVRP